MVRLLAPAMMVLSAVVPSAPAHAAAGFTVYMSPSETDTNDGQERLRTHGNT